LIISTGFHLCVSRLYNLNNQLVWRRKKVLGEAGKQKNFYNLCIIYSQVKRLESRKKKSTATSSRCSFILLGQIRSPSQTPASRNLQSAREACLLLVLHCLHFAIKIYSKFLLHLLFMVFKCVFEFFLPFFFSCSFNEFYKITYYNNSFRRGFSP
jgi:hypothetical protein